MAEERSTDRTRSPREGECTGAPEEPGGFESKSSRREMLLVAHKLSVVAAALGLSTVGLASRLAAHELSPLQALLAMAIETGDMEAAISRHEEELELNARQLAALRSIRRSDLELLKDIQRRLAPIDGKLGVIVAHA